VVERTLVIVLLVVVMTSSSITKLGILIDQICRAETRVISLSTFGACCGIVLLTGHAEYGDHIIHSNLLYYSFCRAVECML